VIARRIAAGVLGTIVVAAVCAPVLAPHDPRTTFRDYLHAPPTRLHVQDADGRWHAPFYYPLRLVNRLESRYEEDRAQPTRLHWFDNGRLLTDPAGATSPWLIAGTDGSGRDVFAFAVHGARASLGIAAASVGIAALLGLLVGGLAGSRGGWADAALMRGADVLAILPAIYVVVALRAALPLVLPPATAVLMLIAILSLVSAPWFARGVRAIVSRERALDHTQAARALGASDWRVLTRHLLPATRGFVITQATLLLPAVIVAEATLSFLGLGLPDTVPSWGTALREAMDVTAIADYPWILLPVVGVFLTTWAANALAGE
jgi:peptide/nickel transport system permease protein